MAGVRCTIVGLTLVAVCVAQARPLASSLPGALRQDGATAAAPDTIAQTDAVRADVALFRVFLTDGSSVPCYGEYARVGDEIVFSMPLGASVRQPRLQLITLPASSVNWPRTERYAASVRYQRYAADRGEVDFAVLTAEVAATLNEIALTTDPKEALAIADRARQMLIEWPSSHFGYRQNDIGDIVALIDEAVAGLSPSGRGSLQLSLVALPPQVPLEPVLGLPSVREQIGRLLTLSATTPRAADRSALLRAALEVLEGPSDITEEEMEDVRDSIQERLRNERAVDARYARLSDRSVDAARRAATRGRVADVERVIADTEREDTELGGLRPDTMRALRADLQARLDAARDLRLRRDQWQLRRRVYRGYVETVSAQLVQLVKARRALEDIRRLDGPAPLRLIALKDTLAGGAERLAAMAAPEGLQATHELLVSAWRFAESAADGRHAAVIAGDLAAAWQASSAAAGSLMLLARAQDEIRAALEPPRPR